MISSSLKQHVLSVLGFHIQYDKAEDMCAKLMRKMLKKIDHGEIL